MTENVGLFLLYAITSGLGLTFLKQGLPADILSVKRIAVLGGVLYLVSFGTWLRIVSRTDITMAYPIAVALTFLSLTIFSASVLGVPITLMRIIGMTVILGGIAIVLH